MDLFTLTFNKSFDQISIEDIVSFFNDIHTESNRLEFKSYISSGKDNDKLKSIIRSICAFLNSEGGILIWGAPQGKNQPNKKEKVFSGQPTFIDEYIEPDRLINIISDSITPLPISVSVRVLGESNRCIYLFNIQPSTIKPHQYDNKYFIRLDGQTRVAPHYYIESMFRQIKYPELEGYIKFGQAEIVKEGVELSFETIIFNWSPLQNEQSVIIVVYTNEGVFCDYNKGVNTIYREYINDGHQSFTRMPDDILFYGSPFRNTHKLLFENSYIEEKKEIFILLSFGGKSSPQKRSLYKLKLDYNEANLLYVNLLETIENKLISELGLANWSIKEGIIRNAIGR